MAKQQSDVQAKILEAVEQQLRRAGDRSLTLETVATETGCAKGLVNYHFKSKGDLLAAAAGKLFRDREDLWKTALKADEPDAVFQQAWNLINLEVSGGFWNAWASLSASKHTMTVQTVNAATTSFNASLAISLDALLRNMGLSPTKPLYGSCYQVGQLLQRYGRGETHVAKQRVQRNGE